MPGATLPVAGAYSRLVDHGYGDVAPQFREYERDQREAEEALEREEMERELEEDESEEAYEDEE